MQALRGRKGSLRGALWARLPAEQQAGSVLSHHLSSPRETSRPEPACRFKGRGPGPSGTRGAGEGGRAGARWRQLCQSPQGLTRPLQLPRVPCRISPEEGTVWKALDVRLEFLLCLETAWAKQAQVRSPNTSAGCAGPVAQGHVRRWGRARARGPLGSRTCQPLSARPGAEDRACHSPGDPTSAGSRAPGADR